MTLQKLCTCTGTERFQFVKRLRPVIKSVVVCVIMEERYSEWLEICCEGLVLWSNTGLVVKDLFCDVIYSYVIRAKDGVIRNICREKYSCLLVTTSLRRQ